MLNFNGIKSILENVKDSKHSDYKKNPQWSQYIPHVNFFPNELLEMAETIWTNVTDVM